MGREIVRRHISGIDIDRLGRLGAFDAACNELRDFVAADGRSNRPFVVILADDNGREFTSGATAAKLGGTVNRPQTTYQEPRK